MDPKIILNIILILLVAWVLGDLFRRAICPGYWESCWPA